MQNITAASNLSNWLEAEGGLPSGVDGLLIQEHRAPPWRQCQMAASRRKHRCRVLMSSSYRKEDDEEEEEVGGDERKRGAR